MRQYPPEDAHGAGHYYYYLLIIKPFISQLTIMSLHNSFKSYYKMWNRPKY